MRFASFCIGTIVLALTGLAVQAQGPPASAAPATLFFGAHIGYSRHQLSGTEVDFTMQRRSSGYSGLDPQNHPLRSITAGFVARQQLYKVLWLQEELNYVRKGGQLTGAGFYDEDPIVINYVQVPVLLHVQLPVAGALAVYAQAGGVLNLGLNGRHIDPNYYAGGNKYGGNPLVPAPAIGAGLAWQQPRRSYYLNFRYSADSRDFFERTYLGSNYTLRNKGILLTAGVLFGQSAQPPVPSSE